MGLSPGGVQVAERRRWKLHNVQRKGKFPELDNDGAKWGSGGLNCVVLYGANAPFQGPLTVIRVAYQAIRGEIRET